MNDLDPKTLRYLQGMVTGDEMQEPPGADGDPQLAALTQYLQVFSSRLDSEDVVLDVGSGRGILAHEMLHTWPSDNARPWYYAVDRDVVIESLDLPVAVHNHSRKIRFEDFLRSELPCALERVKVVVVRNVLHELDIGSTAATLVALRRVTAAGAQVYLQDMVSLPKNEREKVGWPPHLLRVVLEAAGFHFDEPVVKRSHSGTEWFVFLLKERADAPVRSRVDLARVVSEAREQQRSLRTELLAKIGRAPGGDTSFEYTVLIFEIGALGTQLQQHQYEVADPLSRSHVVAGVPLLTLPRAALDYADEMPSPKLARSGLRAILSSKSLIDLPRLLESATNRLWFAGYSQRLLFAHLEVRAALLDAGIRGVDIRVLLVDPESPVAVARSRSDAYSTPGEFVADVVNTIAGFTAFDAELRAKNGGAAIDAMCELRSSAGILSSSFFVVDDLCICSLYSSTLTGGAGTAFVFGSSSVQPNGYFQVLVREFQDNWRKADPKVR